MQKAFLSGEQWAKLEPLLPKTKSRGRPWADHRRVLEGILWVLKTAARWRNLPQDYPTPAGGACANGKNMRCRSKSGASSSAILPAGQVGLERIIPGRQFCSGKKRQVCRQNQAGQTLLSHQLTRSVQNLRNTFLIHDWILVEK
jgi:transposase